MPCKKRTHLWRDGYGAHHSLVIGLLKKKVIYVFLIMRKFAIYYLFIVFWVQQKKKFRKLTLFVIGWNSIYQIKSLSMCNIHATIQGTTVMERKASQVCASSTYIIWLQLGLEWSRNTSGSHKRTLIPTIIGQLTSMRIKKGRQTIELYIAASSHHCAMKLKPTKINK